jgi:hypothetical protein
MAPSFVPAKQLETYKIWKEDEKKIICKAKESKKTERKKLKTQSSSSSLIWDPSLNSRSFYTTQEHKERILKTQVQTQV